MKGAVKTEEQLMLDILANIKILAEQLAAFYF